MMKVFCKDCIFWDITHQGTLTMREGADVMRQRQYPSLWIKRQGQSGQRLLMMTGAGKAGCMVTRSLMICC